MTAPSPPLISRYHMDVLSLQPRDKATMLGVSFLDENRGYFPEKRNAFVLDDQDGRCDVTCKPEL